jgi:hypothetical protein
LLQLKIGFNKNGLTLNSKQFDPLNLSVNGHGIESDRSVNDVDAFDILESLASVRDSDKRATKSEGLDALKTLMQKVKA